MRVGQQELATCQRGREGRVPTSGPPFFPSLAKSYSTPASCPLCLGSPGCGPAGEELTLEVPVGLTVPATAAAAAACGRDEKAGADWTPGALQSGGCCAGSRGRARRGQGRPPGGAPRRGGRGRLAWGISSSDGRARWSPAHLGESGAAVTEGSAERRSGAAEPPRNWDPSRSSGCTSGTSRKGRAARSWTRGKGRRLHSWTEGGGVRPGWLAKARAASRRRLEHGTARLKEQG